MLAVPDLGKRLILILRGGSLFFRKGPLTLYKGERRIIENNSIFAVENSYIQFYIQIHMAML